MTFGASGAAAAAQAAAQAWQMLLMEEERMTPYSPDELNNDWEFKIVRANTRAFRKPEVLQKLIEEEARAGWVMLEKFDDSRVRFKRPRSARSRDATLPSNVDPYRTHFGISPEKYVVGLVVGAIVGVFLLIFIFIYVMTSSLGLP